MENIHLWYGNYLHQEHHPAVDYFLIGAHTVMFDFLHTVWHHKHYTQHKILAYRSIYACISHTEHSRLNLLIIIKGIHCASKEPDQAIISHYLVLNLIEKNYMDLLEETYCRSWLQWCCCRQWSQNMTSLKTKYTTFY